MSVGSIFVVKISANLYRHLQFSPAGDGEKLYHPVAEYNISV